MYFNRLAKKVLSYQGRDERSNGKEKTKDSCMRRRKAETKPKDEGDLAEEKIEVMLT